VLGALGFLALALDGVEAEDLAALLLLMLGLALVGVLDLLAVSDLSLLRRSGEQARSVKG
jgi:hypothetical protein